MDLASYPTLADFFFSIKQQHADTVNAAVTIVTEASCDNE